MNLGDTWDILAKKLSGEASPEENRFINELLLDNDQKHLYEIISCVKVDYDMEQAIRMKDQILERTFDKIFSSQGSKQTGFSKKWLLFSLAAGLALLIGLTPIFLYYKNANNTSPMVVLTCPSGLSTIVLPDSSIVTLNAGTTLKYPATFDKKVRRVDLVGEAFFKVKENHKKPFIVATKEMDVKVLGTTFNILAYPQDEEISTTLLTGSVELTNKINQQHCTLVPNQIAILNKTTSEIRLQQVDPEYFIGWLSGNLLFKGLPFSTICKLLERKFDCKIEIKNARLQEKVFTGKFVNNESLPQILEIIKMNVPFSYAMKDNRVIIN